MISRQAKRRAAGLRRYELNGAAMRAAATAHYLKNAVRIRAERAAKRTDETRRVAAKRQRERYAALRAEMLTEYGGKCSCCGIDHPAFLELDHAETNGAAHRREIGRGAYRTYRWLKLRGWPKDGFRLLCANCNQGRQRNGGRCPHEG